MPPMRKAGIALEIFGLLKAGEPMSCFQMGKKLKRPASTLHGVIYKLYANRYVDFVVKDDPNGSRNVKHWYLPLKTPDLFTDKDQLTNDMM